MNNFGFVRVAAASPILKVADCDFNTNEILRVIKDAEKQNVSALVFPEMCITGYTVADLFHQQLLLTESLKSLELIIEQTKKINLILFIGIPLQVTNKLYNVAVVLHKGKILGVVPKTFIPNNAEFYDGRWFSSAAYLKQNEIELCGQIAPIGTDLIFKAKEFNFAVEICEDLWTPIPPSSLHALNGADVIFNLSASPDVVGKHLYRKSLVAQQSARCYAGYVYASAGNGESTTDLVFSGASLIAENGSILAEAERFTFDSQMIVSDIDVEKLRNERLRNKSFSSSEYKYLDSLQYRHVLVNSDETNEIGKPQRFINPTPFVPSDDTLDEKCSEIFSIQIGGLAKRMLHTGCKTLVVGVSGGLDSTLALLAMAKTCNKINIPRQNIYGITMPGFGTTNRTYNNALLLMKSLGITIKEISIKDAVIHHFKDIDHDVNLHDVTYENTQARERTQILMDYANKVNGLVVGTGDLSELALGWCTYNGDHMSMYAVNTGIPKTLVKTLVGWVADTQIEADAKNVLHDILDTPVSPELLPSDNDKIVQLTEDSVGPYILHDFFLYNMLRFGYEPQKIYFMATHAFIGKYENEEILKWLRVFYRRFFSQQFKRSCIPDAPKVGSINLSPRGDWRMPSDASSSVWLKQLASLA